ncbi:hypothetical protein [Desulfovibrio sp. DV]|uniref:hypothetical protein n=1 Tax=Desulfovibrio sp. DV TaxID=1844708 RepID=UPI000A850F7F|nr:hypothetical protein [Desulfovibrio sp. DV]
MVAEKMAASVDEKLLFDNKKLLVDAMLAEKRDLRSELVGFERTQIQVIALFSLGVAAFMKILLDNGDPKSITAMHKNEILISLSQFSYVLCLVVNSVLSWINVHYSYIRAVEKKINELLGERIIIWESVMVEKHINKNPSPFTLGFAVMGISLLITFVLMVYKIGNETWDGWYFWFAGLEVIAYVIVFVMNMQNTNRAYATACDVFQVK